MTARARRFWVLYALAWLPPLAIYFFAFQLQGRMDAASMALTTLVSVVPDALLGAGVVVVSRRLWRAGSKRRILVSMLALGLAFTTAATWSKATASMVLMRREGLEVSWAAYDRALLLWQAFFCLITFAVIASVGFGSNTAARLREEEGRRSQAELLRARAELKALRAQFNPHFLFNTLHSVRALVSEQPTAAEEALEALGDLLRYALRVQDAEDEGVLLREEWGFVRVYLELERLRLGERLRVFEDVSDEALRCVVPAFVLQPLVENAIRHGIAPRPGGGSVRIRARVAAGALELEVRDEGAGAAGGATKGAGKGLELVRQRLQALHGAASSMAVVEEPGASFAVTLRMPASEQSP